MMLEEQEDGGDDLTKWKFAPEERRARGLTCSYCCVSLAIREHIFEAICPGVASIRCIEKAPVLVQYNGAGGGPSIGGRKNSKGVALRIRIRSATTTKRATKNIAGVVARVQRNSDCIIDGDRITVYRGTKRLRGAVRGLGRHGWLGGDGWAVGWAVGRHVRRSSRSSRRIYSDINCIADTQHRTGRKHR